MLLPENKIEQYFGGKMIWRIWCYSTHLRFALSGLYYHANRIVYIMVKFLGTVVLDCNPHVFVLRSVLPKRSFWTVPFLLGRSFVFLSQGFLCIGGIENQTSSWTDPSCSKEICHFCTIVELFLLTILEGLESRRFAIDTVGRLQFI